jgi:hypothetical protein
MNQSLTLIRAKIMNDRRVRPAGGRNVGMVDAERARGLPDGVREMLKTFR